jgi:O-antigen/teichoic acid export membrane protein
MTTQGRGAAQSTAEISPRGRLGRHLAEPFYRNAYALVLNTGISGALGIVYWFMAAQKYDDADVGRGSAVISTMMLLSGIVAVNVTGTLNRLIPGSGRRTLGLIVWSYLLTSGAVALLTVAFFATLDWWGPTFDLLRDSDARMLFLVAVVAAGIFTVQDGILTGLRSSVWVPVENAIFGAAKLALLVVVAPVMPRNGVFLSWVIPMVAVLLPTNLLIFFRLVPQHVRRSPKTTETLSPAQIRRFFAGDYLGALFLFATVYLVPVIVAGRVEPDVYAYFYIAWAISSVMNVVSVNLATSLTVEGVYEGASLTTNFRAALARSLGILLLGAVVVSMAAPYALGLFGKGYQDAVPLLQLLVFATLPRAVIDVYLGALRVQNRPRQIAWVQVLRGVLVLGAVVVLLHFEGVFLALGLPRITAVGVAVLISQTVAMLVVLPGVRRLLTTSQPVAATRSPGEPSHVGGAEPWPGN